MVKGIAESLGPATFFLNYFIVKIAKEPALLQALYHTQDIEIDSIDDSEPDNNDILNLISKCLSRSGCQ